MNVIEAYRLRMRLVAAGHIPAPMHNGRAVEIPHQMPGESCVRGWATLHENATETGIVDLETRRVTLVTAVPASAAELQAMRAIRQRTKNQQRLEARRRQKGIPERAAWLQAHSQDRGEPWKKLNMSRPKWYRLGKPDPGETGATTL